MPGARVASGLFHHPRAITMPKVICTRPNASLNINGVNFTPTEDGTGVLSDEISDDAAELFLSIPGYELADEPQKKASAPAPVVTKTAAAKAPAAPAKPGGKKAAVPEKPAADAEAAPAGTVEDGSGSDKTDTGSQDTAPGAGEGGGNDDTNFF